MKITGIKEALADLAKAETGGLLVNRWTGEVWLDKTVDPEEYQRFEAPAITCLTQFAGRRGYRDQEITEDNILLWAEDACDLFMLGEE